MFKGHPKGLLVLFFSNMGERFGYYTMIAIFVLYLQSHFGLDAIHAGNIYGYFLFGIYFFPLLGGILADKMFGYSKTIIVGTILMFVGYALLAKPGMQPWFIYISLLVIALGTGLFKGNLAVLVGNLYDDPKYNKLRDVAFNIYYMGINIGAFFAPDTATGISKYILRHNNLFYDAKIPTLAHQYIDGSLQNVNNYLSIAQQQDASVTLNSLGTFSHHYLDSLSASYNAGFGIAALSMVVSLLIFIIFKKYWKHVDITESEKKEKLAKENVKIKELTPKQTRERLTALIMVFITVMFFWMAFHQNGFTLTLFAKNYTVPTVGKWTFIPFDLTALLSIVGIVLGIILLFIKKNVRRNRYTGIILIVVFAILAYYRISSFTESGNHISAPLFQKFNPFFIVVLTPIIVAFFTLLGKKGKEPSSVRKIGTGMLITVIGFSVMIVASQGLPSVHSLEGGVASASMLVSPYWLITTYFILTVSELFLSPMGLSFVSKVAPPKYKGLMQGGWLAATAIGTLLAGKIGPFYEEWELWQFFLLIVALALLSAIFIFSIMKKLERITES
jgi:POT family proton-dependent oligopeptide transporter